MAGWETLRRAASLATLLAVIGTTALAPAAVDAAGTGTIEGEIVGPGGSPLAEVWACAYLVQGEGDEEGCDLTGAGGLYSIPGLVAGKYKVEFWSESTAPSYVGEFYDDKRFWGEADEVEVAEGAATTGIDAELTEAATIEGEVDALASGEPVEHAVVCAQVPSGEPVGCALVRPDGSYTLPGLAPGEYRVQFIPASNIYNLLNQFYDHKDAFAEADPLVLIAGETTAGIDADLKSGAEIHGTIYSATTGLPISGVLVCALFMERVEGAWVPAGCASSEIAGTYVLSRLWTDSYKVVFSPDFEGFFGEELDDGYLTQYFNEKPTLAEADLLPVLAPEIRGGIDGRVQPAHPASANPVSGTPSIIAMSKPRRKPARHCRAGFRKRKVGGKRRCVKKHKRGHKHRHPR